MAASDATSKTVQPATGCVQMSSKRVILLPKSSASLSPKCFAWHCCMDHACLKCVSLRCSSNQTYPLHVLPTACPKSPYGQVKGCRVHWAYWVHSLMPGTKETKEWTCTHSRGGTSQLDSSVKCPQMLFCWQRAPVLSSLAEQSVCIPAPKLATCSWLKGWCPGAPRVHISLNKRMSFESFSKSLSGSACVTLHSFDHATETRCMSKEYYSLAIDSNYPSSASISWLDNSSDCFVPPRSNWADLDCATSYTLLLRTNPGSTVALDCHVVKT